MSEEKIEDQEPEEQETLDEEFPECHTKNYGKEEICEVCGVSESCLEGMETQDRMSCYGTEFDHSSDCKTCDDAKKCSDEYSKNSGEETREVSDDDIEVVTENDGEEEPVICQKCQSTMLCPTCDVDVNHTTLVNFVSKISDVQWGMENGFHPGQLNMLREMIAEMQNNKGYTLEGMRSLDGYIMHPCPKHDYAPISICLHQCEFYSGRDDRGVCICKEQRIDGHKRFDHLGARQEEDRLRQMYWDDAQRKINLEDDVRNEFTEFGLGKKDEKQEGESEKGKKA